jgi:hypothetical protein
MNAARVGAGFEGGGDAGLWRGPCAAIRLLVSIYISIFYIYIYLWGLKCRLASHDREDY